MDRICLHLTTHCGAYKRGGSEEREPYPGGHFISYNIATGEFEDYGIGEPEEGMVCMDMDTERGRMYTVTYPGLIFIYYDIASGTKKSFGKAVATPGIDDVMKVTGPRSLAIDPRTGNVYWNNFDETIVCYDYAKDTVETIDEPDFNRSILNVSMPGQYRINWRSIRWNDMMQKFYGVMYQSEYLFSFEPLTKDIEIIDRITAEPKRRSGQGHYGSLAFEFSPDEKTIYYLVSSQGQIAYPDTTINGRVVHLVTYNISHRQYIDHGPLELDDGRKPSYCQSLAVGNDDNLYAICAIPFTELESEKGKKLVEYRPPWTPKKNYQYSITERNLVVIKNPLAGK